MNPLERGLDRLRATFARDGGWSTSEAPLVRALSAAALADDGSNMAAVARVEGVALAAFRERMASAPAGARERPAVPATPDHPRVVAGRRVADRGRRMPRRLAGLGAATAALVLAAASAVAGPASPLYDVRVTWEAMTLPSDPDLRLAAEAKRLDRRLAEAQAALVAGVPEGAHTALGTYASICRSISPAGADASAVATFMVVLHAQAQALETMRNHQGPVSAWVDDALRAAGGLEQRFRDGPGPPSPAGPLGSPDGSGLPGAPAGGPGGGGAWPPRPGPPAGSGTPSPAVPGASGGTGGSGRSGESGESGAPAGSGASGASGGPRPASPEAPAPGSPGSGSPESGSSGPAGTGSGQPGSTPPPAGSGGDAGSGGTTSSGPGAGAVPTPSPVANPAPGSGPGLAGGPETRSRSSDGA